MSTRRYDAGAAAQRARADATTNATAAATTVRRVAAKRLTARSKSEYQLLSVWQIDPAPWQPRQVFEDLEELAASIQGTADAEGVGVLAPVLVRRMEDGRYQLIDGERRLRAGRLIADRSPGRDFLLPARIYSVSERMARVMGQTGNLERSALKPIEVALGYQTIRDAVSAEIGTQAGTLRALKGLGWHGKSQIGDYLRIADLLTDGTVQATGLVGADGEPDFESLAKLNKKQLDRVVRIKDPVDRAAALAEQVARSTGTAPPRAKAARARPGATSPEERRAEITSTVPFAMRVRAPADMLDRGEAAALVRDELAPAILALAERAHGGPGRAGFFVTAAPAHAVLVLPTEIETLTTAQVEQLTAIVSDLRTRAARALRHRRGVAAGQKSGALDGAETENA